MTNFEFILADRIQKIRQMNDMYDLENKAYISFSGGKDSTVLSALIDLALPDNKIPRVFINTGIEYRAIVDFVRVRGGARRTVGYNTTVSKYKNNANHLRLSV